MSFLGYIYAAFLEVGEENWEAMREVGMRYRRTFLELGGTKHPSEVFQAFRGRAPTIKPLLIHSGFTK